MNLTMTKKIVVFLLLTITCGLNARTVSENTFYDLKNEVNETIGSISLNREFGGVRFTYRDEVNSLDDQYMLIKIGDSFFDPSGNIIDNGESNKIIDSFTTVIQLSKLTLSEDIQNTLYRKGHISRDIINTSLVLNNLKTNNGSFLIKNRSETYNIQAWIFNKEGEAINFVSDLYIPFFDQEAFIFEKLFGEDSTLTYEQKAIFYLSTFFIEEVRNAQEEVIGIKNTQEREQMINLASTYYNQDRIALPSLGIIGNESKLEVLYYQLKGSHQSFRNSFYKHFYTSTETIKSINNRNVEFELPYLDIGKERFNNIYKNKNIYIDSYLRFLQLKGKPALSTLINNGIQAEDKNIKYNFSQYESLTEEEGKELAKSALKYLTWGVEYTQFESNNTFNLNNNMSSVFNLNREVLTTWVDNDEPENKNQNYFPGEIKDIEIEGTLPNIIPTTKNHILNGNYIGEKIRILNKANNSINISRIDLWTSKNLVLEPGIISQVYIGTDAAVSPSDTNAKKYYDNEIWAGEVDGNHILKNREVVIKDDPETVDINDINCPAYTYGYKFRKEEKVSAIVLATGVDVRSKIFEIPQEGFSKNSAAVKSYSELDQFGLEIYVGNEKVLNAKEIMISNTWNEIYLTKDKNLGFSLATSDGGSKGTDGEENNNSIKKNEVVYYYYIFDEPVFGNEVKIIDKTGTESLVISELMVFEDNPIQHITKETNKLSFPSVGIYKDWDWAGLDLLGPFNRSVYKNGNTGIYAIDFEPLRSLYNEDDKEYKTIDPNVVFVDLDLLYNNTNYISRNYHNFQQIVIREFNQNSESLFTSGFSMLIDSSINMSTKLFTKDESSSYKNLYDNGFISSPFKNKILENGTEKEVVVSGNPIPYTGMGIDSPKSFNYKMIEQNNAREWYLSRYPKYSVKEVIKPDGSKEIIKEEIINNIYLRDRFNDLDADNIIDSLKAYTGSRDISFKSGYFSEIDLFNEVEGFNMKVNIIPSLTYKYNISIGDFPVLSEEYISKKPFLPGFIPENKKGYVTNLNSLYLVDKIAGVDSLGLLVGSFSMTNINGNLKNITNADINKELDNIYKANSFDFHIRNENESIINKAVRLSKSELEKVSVIISDLKDIREGDLLVKFEEGKDPHIGIVVSNTINTIPENELTIEKMMENILVISTKREFRMATIGRWKAPNGSFGGFANIGDEKSYHVRRLLKIAEGTELKEYEEPTWELLNNSMDRLFIDIDFNLSEYENNKAEDQFKMFDQLIPNTGEALIIPQITIKGHYTGSDDDESFNLLSRSTKIKILPPIDPYLGEEPDGYPNYPDSNVFSNKGDGLEFYAVNGDDFYLLAKFLRQENGEYIVDYSDLTSDFPNVNSSLDKPFNSFGAPNEGFDLYVEFNKLVFEAKDNQNRRVKYKEFAVRPIKTGEVRIGDDFLLNFGLLENENIKGNAEIHSKVAIYDKKMLWRANLYMKENLDWNDVYKWDGQNKPWIDDNEWNRLYKPVNGSFSRLVDNNNEPNENEYLPGLDRGDGGQVIDISSFVCNPFINKGVETNTVAYSFGCNDNPFEFNDEMRQQQNLLANYYSKEGIKYKVPRSQWPAGKTKIEDFTLHEYQFYIKDMTPEEIEFFPEMYVVSIEGWDKPTTPTGTWTNDVDQYIKPSTLYPNIVDFHNYLTLPNNFNNYNRDFPFVPGLALYYRLGPLWNNFMPNWTNVISAGVDCIGFASRSASYGKNEGKRNSYVWEDSIPENFKDKDKWFGNPAYPNYNINDNYTAFIITKKTDRVGDPVNGFSYPGLKRVIPGDVVIFGNNSHIAMIHSSPLWLGENNDLNQLIGLLESTWAGNLNWAKVTNEQTLADDARNWVIVRLREN